MDDFQTIATRVNATQALWLTALAITGLLLLGAASRRGVALAVLPAVIGAAIALPLLPPGGYRAAAAYDPDAVELVCDNNGPQVCMTRVHAHLLPAVVTPARQALTLLAAKLPNAPTRAVEGQQPISWARSSKDPVRARHQGNLLVFDLASAGIFDRAEYAEPYFLSFLLGAAWEQDCAAAPSASPPRSDGEYLFREVAVAWLHGQPTTAQDLKDPEERRQAVAAYQALTSLPQAEQGRRMALARDAALDCRGDAVLAALTRGTP